MKKSTPVTQRSDVLFIRGVPVEILEGLDVEVAKIRATSPLYRAVGRSTLALQYITDALEAAKAKP